MVIKDNEFRILTSFMKENYGINLSKKRTLIEGRLGLLLKKNGFDSFESFIEYAINDSSGEAVNLLLNKLTTNYTYFYREEEHYQYVESVILPELTGRIKNHDLRCWSAGCSSGEEAYTLAMTIDQYFGSDKKAWDSTILATDLSKSVLNKAKKGIYGFNSLEKLPRYKIEEYFTQTDENNFAIKDFLKKEVVFKYFNLLDENYPFKKKFHLIFCRNVMIYFERSTKELLVKKFYDVLENGGYLIIGHSESLNGMMSNFKYVRPSIYRK